MAHVILIPGLWLNASTWEEVLPYLHQAGHTPVPLTLPGMESVSADRSEVRLSDHVDAVVREIDAVPADGEVIVVGHSMGAALAALAVDARRERVARVVYIGGFPSDAGGPLTSGFETDGADLPMPDPSNFDDADVADLDQAALAALVAGAIPSPASLTTDLVTYTDDQRHSVPTTMICPEYSPDDLRAWIEQGALPELATLSDLSYIDLDSGHWPQITVPSALADAIIQAVGGSTPVQ